MPRSKTGRQKAGTTTRRSKSGGTMTLAKLKTKWAAAKKKAAEIGEDDGEDLPPLFPFEDGRYVFRVTHAELKNSNSGNFGALFTTICLNQEQDDEPFDGFGQKRFKWRKLESAEDLAKLVAKDLAPLGYGDLVDADDISAIEDAMSGLSEEKPALTADLKTYGDSEFQNMFFRKIVDEDDLADLGAADPEEGAEAASSSNEGEEGFEFKFENINSELEPKIQELCEEAELPCTDDQTWMECLESLASHHGLSGTFTSAPNVLAACEGEQGESFSLSFDDDKVPSNLESRITELAEAHEIPCTDDETWVAVLEALAETVGAGGAHKTAKSAVEAIEQAAEAGDEGEETVDESGEEEVVEDGVPVQGDVVSFKPRGKTKAVQGKVVSVDEDDEKVDVKVGKTLYKKLPFDRVEVVTDDD